MNIGKAVLIISFEGSDIVAKELTVKRMISFNGPDGEYVDFDTISEEQKEQFKKAVSDKVSFVLSNIRSD